MPKRVRKAIGTPQPGSPLPPPTTGPSGAELNGIVDPFREYGRSGLRYYGNFVIDEFLRELSGRTGRAVYREMSDNDPTIGAVLFAIKQQLRAVSIRVEPGTEDNEGRRAAELVDTALHDMSSTWSDLLSDILSVISFGWQASELVYKRRLGDEPGMGADGVPLPESRYADGLLGWRKIPARGQESLWGWNFDASGGIQSLIQWPAPTYELLTVPIEKLLLFRVEGNRGSPESRSVLRNAYLPWYFLKRIRVSEAIGISRDLAGIPIAWAPPDVVSAAAKGEQLATQQTLRKIVTNIHVDEQHGLMMPLVYDPKTGNKLYDLTLLQSAGQKQFDTDAVVQRYQREIAATVLADFLFFGHGQSSGNRALGGDRIDFFLLGLQGWMTSILSVFNRYGIPRLLKLNGMRAVNPPQLAHGAIERKDLKALGEYITALSGAGFPLFPNGDLESYLLTAADMPVPPELTQELGKAARRWDPAFVEVVSEIRKLRAAMGQTRAPSSEEAEAAAA